MRTRRSFLKSSVVLAAAIGAPSVVRAARFLPTQAPPERALHLYNTHTGESLRSVFWAEGQFLPAALDDINHLLRDHRNDQVAPIDPQLLVLLDQISARFGTGQTVHVISGYRSPESNALLAAASDGVARRSAPGRQLLHLARGDAGRDPGRAGRRRSLRHLHGLLHLVAVRPHRHRAPTPLVTAPLQGATFPKVKRIDERGRHCRQNSGNFFACSRQYKKHDDDEHTTDHHPRP